MKKKKYISKKAQEHASKGTFIYLKKHTPDKVLTMKSGGHGQENIRFLKRKGITFGIDSEFSNGVRLGHIDRHHDKRNTHKNGHTWFPKGWGRTEIKKAGEHIASLKRNQTLFDNHTHSGRYRGVSVGIIARKGIIKTIFPLFDVNRHARKKAHIIPKSRR